MLTSNNITEGRKAPPAGEPMAKEYPAGQVKRRPTHPGAIVKGDIEALGMSVNAAAIRIGIGRAALGKLVNEQVAVTPEMALRLGTFFRNGPELLLRMQMAVDLWDAAQKIGPELAAIEPAEWDREEIDG